MMSSILDLTQETDIIGATHHLHDRLLSMVKYRRERKPENAVHVLMFVFGKIAPGLHPVDRQWRPKTATAAACGNGIADVSGTAPENAMITAVDGLQEVATETEIEKDTARRATTVGVEAKALGEIDHLTMEDRPVEK